MRLDPDNERIRRFRGHSCLTPAGRVHAPSPVATNKLAAFAVRFWPALGLVRGGVGIALVLGLAGVLACQGEGPSDPPERMRNPSSEASEAIEPAVTQPPAAGRLTLVGLSGYEDSLGYQHVKGDVTNVSDAALGDVTVTVMWYTDWEDFVTKREGVLEDDPLSSGQTTSFDISGPVNPYASKYSVAFTAATGGTILEVDSSWLEVR